MAARYYSNTAVETTLAGGVTSGATTITVSATTGFPATTPFTLALDAGTGSEELVSVTEVADLTLTVERAYDSTTAVAHSAGAVVRHVHSAADFRDARAHEQATAAVHGVTGVLLGSTDAQTVSNKTFDTTNTFPSTLATDTEVTNAVNTHAADTSSHGVTGDVVGTTDTQTLTNKTLTSPVIPTLVPNVTGGVYATAPLESAPITDYPIGVTYHAVTSATDWPTLNLGSFPVATLKTLRARASGLYPEKSSCQWAYVGHVGVYYRDWNTGTAAWSNWVAVADAGDWTAYTPTWTATSTNPSGTAPTGAYRKVGKTVNFRIKLDVGVGTTFGSGVWMFSLPVAAKEACAVGGARLNHGSSNQAGSVYIDPSSLSVCRVLYDGGSVNASGPWTWAAGDALYIQGTYESAS